VQQKVFLEQLELAHFLKIPAVIHLRDAFLLMYNLLKENKNLLEYGAVLHCFSGSKEMLKEYLKLGLFVSYGGSITFKNAVDKPDIVRSTPLDMFMLETDCPYLTPVPFRGKTNYPKYVNLVKEKVAEMLNKSSEEIDEITTKNAKTFFAKIK
jgi:TatD DNase family protein